MKTPHVFTESEIADISQSVEKMKPGKPFGGVFLDWRFVDYTRTVKAGKALVPDENALPIIVYGVLPFDKAGRFGFYRPIRTSNLLCFDLQNMLIETLNTIYLLGGKPRSYKKVGAHEDIFKVLEKQSRQTRKLARLHRSRVKH